MTVGFGMSIGTVNSVSAVAGDRDRPAVRLRRTAVTFDSTGAACVGGMPRFAPVATDFADLTRRSEPVTLGGRIWTPADLVAAVVGCLVGAAEPTAGPVATFPACYGTRQLSPLRHALDRSGAADTVLMPEPVAAVEWLDAEHGVSESGLTLVYDLGGSSLDVAVVRTEGDRDERGVLGRAVRSRRYGGRPLGTVLARYARTLEPGGSAPVSKVVSLDDTARLRAWTVRNSLPLVRKCVQGAGLTMRDIDRVLLVGGAARPPEVAQVLAELGRPVLMSPDPAHTVAIGAATAAARRAGAGTTSGRYARGAAVVSSAAVASAVAVSAASMLGSGPIGTDGPALEFAPALAGPARDARQDFGRLPPLEGLDDAPPLGGEAEGVWSVTKPVARSYGAVAQSVSTGATAVAERPVATRGAPPHTSPISRRGASPYADPARFTNPLPFDRTPSGPTPAGLSGGRIPSVSLPGSGAFPAPRPPGGSLSNPSEGAAGSHAGTGWAGGTGPGAKASDGPGSAPIAGSPAGTGSAGGGAGGVSAGGAGQSGSAGFGGGSTGTGGSSAGSASSGGDSSGSAPSGGSAGGGSGPAGSSGGGLGNGGVSGGGSASGGSGGGSASDVGKASGGLSGGTSNSGGSSGDGGSSRHGGSSGGKDSGGPSGGGSKSGGSSGGSHGGSGGGGGGGGSRR